MRILIRLGIFLFSIVIVFSIVAVLSQILPTAKEIEPVAQILIDSLHL